MCFLAHFHHFSWQRISCCQLLTAGESWSFPVLASGHLTACCWQATAALNGQTLSTVAATLTCWWGMLSSPSSSERNCPFSEICCQTQGATSENLQRSRRRATQRRGEWGKAFSVCFIMLRSSLCNAYKGAAKAFEFTAGFSGGGGLRLREKQNTLCRFWDEKDGDLERLSCHHSRQHLSARGATLEARELRIRLWFIGFECKHETLVLKTRKHGRLLLTSMNLQNSVCKCRRL